MLDFSNIEKHEENIGTSPIENENVEPNWGLSVNVNFDAKVKKSELLFCE